MAGMEEDSLTGLDLSVLLLPGFDIVRGWGGGGGIQLIYTAGAAGGGGARGGPPPPPLWGGGGASMGVPVWTQ